MVKCLGIALYHMLRTVDDDYREVKNPSEFFPIMPAHMAQGTDPVT